MTSKRNLKASPQPSSFELPPLAPHNPEQPLQLLGGLTPQQFMKRHWHKKPLLVRQAVPGMQPLLSRAELFDLAGQESVESRLLVHRGGQDWMLKQGPFQKRQLPPVSQPAWTLLVQGVDLHHDAVHQLMQSFRFVPDARLDDLMISWASDQGGVGPHYDSYDVFLLQAHGQRHWRIGRQQDLSLVEGLPLKILASFEPEEEWVLEPGDMLYLPPQWAHDGVAVGADCMTYSIGFRAPQRGALAAELALRMGEHVEDEALYRDPKQEAVQQPGRMPEGLVAFAEAGLKALLADRHSLAISLGEILTEPKPKVWFEEAQGDWTPGAVRLDRKTRMLYDDQHVFINGDSLQAKGKDAKLLRVLADARMLSEAQVHSASTDLQEALAEWFVAGWLHRVE
jgi:50S ribosomal protein L16 3-hydroxylase